MGCTEGKKRTDQMMPQDEGDSEATETIQFGNAFVSSQRIGTEPTMIRTLLPLTPE